MAITAYSKVFDSEFQVSQLIDQYELNKNELKLEPNFKKFVKNDVICPICKATGAKIVEAAFNKETGQEIKQTHFAFSSGHDVYCDHYTGNDGIKAVTNPYGVDFNESGSVITEEIRKYVCKAIEKGIFTQEDIKNMRLWFFNLKKEHGFNVVSLEREIKILNRMYSNKYNRKYEYVFRSDKESLDKTDLENEIYDSLSFKLPVPNIPHAMDNIGYGFTRKSVYIKAIALSKKEQGNLVFDRIALEKYYIMTSNVAHKVKASNPIIYEKLGRNTHAAKNNPLMAYAAILLFVSNWDLKKAYEKHSDILYVEEISDPNLGNVIGFNPFIHYDAWRILKHAMDWKLTLASRDIESEYVEEAAKLIEQNDIDMEYLGISF